MHIVMASDHGGFQLKEFLKNQLAAAGHEVEDLGPDCARSCDYPPYAAKAAERVLAADCLGVLICGTGLGMSIAANRFAGVRAALCTNEFMARMAREH
ncbi:MAG TPA: RpiB/LacA/LacB family sugar-phosphate isomerase, partial [Desulfovibrio sp.]